jgi:dihydrofolate reductase
VHPDQVLAWLAAATVQGRRRVYLFGGSRVIAHFIDLDAIDDYYVGIVPVILGDGIRLFDQPTARAHLVLQQTYVDDGVVVVHYRRRRRGNEDATDE